MLGSRKEKENDNSKPTSKQTSKEQKTRGDVIECTSLNLEVTDKNFETAEFTSSEKQVRFSMTTIRTPPSSPKPPHSSSMKNDAKTQSLTREIVPASKSSYKNKTLNQEQMENMVPELTKHLKDNIDNIENIKVNFLEKLEVLPESKA